MKKNNLSQTFGSYIRDLRISLEIGQRELAQKISIAPSYLNDIEKNHYFGSSVVSILPIL